MGFAMAIDGPAGAGKSTIAKMVAKKLGLTYIDTGAMYRAVAYYMYSNGVDTGNEQLVGEKCNDIDIVIEYIDGAQQVILNGENITSHLRDEAVGKLASTVAKMAAVRAKLVELQRKLASESRIVMDGRDIGTCVLPKADVKIYLDASVEERAKRRYKELTEKGVDCLIDIIRLDIEERDYEDMNRDISPLKQARDAILVDSSDMSIDEVVDKICSIYEESLS